MASGEAAQRYLYPPSRTDRPPSPWWYYGWVIYANRGQVARGVAWGGALVLTLAAPGVALNRPVWLWAEAVPLGLMAAYFAVLTAFGR